MQVRGCGRSRHAVKCSNVVRKRGSASLGSPICGVIASCAGMHGRIRFGIRLREAVSWRVSKNERIRTYYTENAESVSGSAAVLSSL
jgi:hypothetical protein